MAVYSMTGYATAQHGGPADESGREAGPVLGMEIRSVNSRFLDLSFRLPEELRQFVSMPVNRPYIELAMKLSNMSRDKLRSVAEDILDITL